MNSEFAKTQKDLDIVRKNYLQAIQNQILVDKKVIDALTLYNYNQTVPHYIPDLRSTNDKLADIEELKITLQPDVPQGTFKTKSLGYKQTANPVEKFTDVAKLTVPNISKNCSA